MCTKGYSRVVNNNRNTTVCLCSERHSGYTTIARNVTSRHEALLLPCTDLSRDSCRYYTAYIRNATVQPNIFMYDGLMCATPNKILCKYWNATLHRRNFHVSALYGACTPGPHSRGTALDYFRRHCFGDLSCTVTRVIYIDVCNLTS